MCSSAVQPAIASQSSSLQSHASKSLSLLCTGGSRRVVWWADDCPAEERATLARFRGKPDDGPVKVRIVWPSMLSACTTRANCDVQGGRRASDPYPALSAGQYWLDSCRCCLRRGLSSNVVNGIARFVRRR